MTLAPLARISMRLSSDPVPVLAFSLLCCVIFSVGLHVGLHQQSSISTLAANRVWVMSKGPEPGHAFPVTPNRVLTVTPSDLLHQAPSVPERAAAATPPDSPSLAPTRPSTSTAHLEPLAAPLATEERPVTHPIISEQSSRRSQPPEAAELRSESLDLVHDAVQRAVETAHTTPDGPMSSFVARGGQFPVVLLTCNRPDMLQATW